MLSKPPFSVSDRGDCCCHQGLPLSRQLHDPSAFGLHAQARHHPLLRHPQALPEGAQARDAVRGGLGPPVRSVAEALGGSIGKVRLSRDIAGVLCSWRVESK